MKTESQKQRNGFINEMRKGVKGGKYEASIEN
jgi:hypothetical protein